MFKNKEWLENSNLLEDTPIVHVLGLCCFNIQLHKKKTDLIS